jgi:hypothetical protein
MKSRNNYFLTERDVLNSYFFSPVEWIKEDTEYNYSFENSGFSLYSQTNGVDSDVRMAKKSGLKISKYELLNRINLKNRILLINPTQKDFVSYWNHTHHWRNVLLSISDLIRTKILIDIEGKKTYFLSNAFHYYFFIL